MRLIATNLLLMQLVIFSHVLFAQDSSRFAAIVIDDLGNDLVLGERLVSLPHALTYAFLPHTKYAKKLIELSRMRQQEIMLHMPMQAISNKAMGPGGLNVSMQRQQFVNIVKANIRAIPGAVGVNNHMGSLLTQSKVKMQWLMEELKQNKNLYFLDSRTHAASIAAVQAQAYHIPNAKRDIFLDHVVTAKEIERQFQRLLKKINRVGHALAIGHPHAETVKALQNWLPKLKAQGIEIVPVSRYISLIKTRSLMWQASLSRSHKVVKN